MLHTYEDSAGNTFHYYHNAVVAESIIIVNSNDDRHVVVNVNPSNRVLVVVVTVNPESLVHVTVLTVKASRNIPVPFVHVKARLHFYLNVVSVLVLTPVVETVHVVPVVCVYRQRYHGCTNGGRRVLRTTEEMVL